MPTTQRTYRLIISLLYIKQFPAELLAQKYHQCSEMENTLDELKVDFAKISGKESGMLGLEFVDHKCKMFT